MASKNPNVAPCGCPRWEGVAVHEGNALTYSEVGHSAACQERKNREHEAAVAAEVAATEREEATRRRMHALAAMVNDDDVAALVALVKGARDGEAAPKEDN